MPLRSKETDFFAQLNLFSLSPIDEPATQTADMSDEFPSIAETFAVQPGFTVTTLDRDFRFPSNFNPASGTLLQKAATNLEAIRLLQRLEREQRSATNDEQLVLVRYTGWGALAQLFHPSPAPEWQSAASELRTLLTDSEYTAARASTPNAHYTSVAVINAIWDALLHLGASAPLHILEPAAGIGHFFGLMPDTLSANAVRLGVELDPISARIAQFLYPDSQIRSTGFESVHLPNGSFDLAIGNVPFGNYPVFDPQYRTQTALTRSIHDYFLVKCVDLVRPGGLLALITSRHTLDKQNGTVRSYLASKANLIAAVRLPNATFRANAGTDVVTDLLFLQRADATHSQLAPQSWLNVKPFQTPDGPATINEYFVNHPQNMLGTPALESTQYQAAEFTLKGTFSVQRCAAVLRAMPANLYRPDPRPRRTLPSIQRPAAENTFIKDGAYGLVENTLVIRNGDSFEPVHPGSSAECRIRRLLVVRDAVREVLRTQLENASDDQILRARELLNLEYDRFCRHFGPINAKENLRAFAGDPDQPLLLSLEDYDPDTKTATKTAIFQQRTIERQQPLAHTDSAAEALLVTLNETGQIDWPRMAALNSRAIPAL